MRWIPALLLPLLAACATQVMTDAAPSDPPTALEAKVVFYRPSRFDRHRAFSLYDGDKFIGLAEAKSCFEYRCAPGAHLFVLHGVTDAAVEATLEGGKTYYVKAAAEPDWLKLRLVLLPATKDSEAAQKVEEDLACCEWRAPVVESVAERNTEEETAAAGGRKARFEGEGKAECLILKAEDGR